MKWLFILVLLTTNLAFADDSDWTFHFQSTTVTQYHPGISAPYSGPLSLSSQAETATSFTSTFFIGRKLWNGAALYFNPEFSGGSGFSGTSGIAGFPNGETYRVSSPDISLSIARVYIRQDLGLGGPQETIGNDLNQVSTTVDISRVSLIAGEFSLSDFFDVNTYSHDPRTQAMNWSIMNNGAWDYAADTRGYTKGFVVELNQKAWALRFAEVMEPSTANGMVMDNNIAQAHSDNAEVELRHEIASHPGKIKLMAYANHANMGNYQVALQQAGTPDITKTQSYSTKYGIGINIEQEITTDLGAFVRAGCNDGHEETWAFTPIDQTISAGVLLKGTDWKRPNDFVGIAGAINGLSSSHVAYLKAGGLDFMIGDGKLNYAPEEILEVYYSWQAMKQLIITPDVQYINNPAYNQDRGPVPVVGLRLHYGF